MMGAKETQPTYMTLSMTSSPVYNSSMNLAAIVFTVFHLPPAGVGDPAFTVFQFSRIVDH
jgi:hypothetical protein